MRTRWYSLQLRATHLVAREIDCDEVAELLDTGRPVFLGERGQAVWSGVAVACPTYRGPEPRPARVYIRPHELDIARRANGTPSLPACVARINPAGAVAKISLHTADGGEIKVDLPFDQYRQLDLQVGDTVHVSPKRARVFLPEPDYAI